MTDYCTVGTVVFAMGIRVVFLCHKNLKYHKPHIFRQRRVTYQRSKLALLCVYWGSLSRDVGTY